MVQGIIKERIIMIDWKYKGSNKKKIRRKLKTKFFWIMKRESRDNQNLLPFLSMP